MLFVARFSDKPGVAERRNALMQDHFAWLRGNDQVLVAGSIRHELDGESLGGLWLIEADSKEDAEAAFQDDPFFANGLRAGFELYHFVKANADRKIPI